MAVDYFGQEKGCFKRRGHFGGLCWAADGLVVGKVGQLLDFVASPESAAAEPMNQIAKEDHSASGHITQEPKCFYFTGDLFKDHNAEVHY